MSKKPVQITHTLAIEHAELVSVFVRTCTQTLSRETAVSLGGSYAMALVLAAMRGDDPPQPWDPR